ncbi:MULTISPECIES: NlpC/P60 family protein [Actinomyces]|nr:NlpC/P60 family protein [Actinomyces respiraculi]
MTRGTLAAVALAMAASLLVPLATADPVTQDDIDSSHAAEESTAQSIAVLEAELAQLAADSEAAALTAQLANEDYLVALDALETATTEAQTAQADADAAAKATEQARSELGAAVVQTYQDGGNALDVLTPYLTSTSLADLADAAAALARIGEQSDAQLQGVEALQAVADTLQALADEKLAAKQTASDAAEEAKTVADEAAVNAANAVVYAQSQRETLIAQLAEQRNTTIELETQYQAQLEAQRKAREEEAARQAAEEAAALAAQQAADEAAAQAAAEAARQQEAAAAPAPAPAPAPEPAPSVDAWVPPSYSGQDVISAAYSYMGVPYEWGGESYGGVDCSGLTMLAYRSAGVYLTHSSRVQYGQGDKVPLSQAQPGDLVFWSSNGTQSGIYHVAMYLGDGQVIEAPTFGYTVRVTSLHYAGVMPYAVRP